MPLGWRWIGWTALVDLDRDGDLDVLADDCCVKFGRPPRRWNTWWNLTRQVYAPQPATLGAPWTLELHALAGSIAVPVAALRPGQVELGALGVFGLDPASAIAAPGIAVGASGLATTVLQVPNDPRLAGVKVYWQALFVDPGTLALHLSNTFEETVR